MHPQPDNTPAPYRLRTARVLRVVDERACDIWRHGTVDAVRFAATFPSPRMERVSPGHLIAIATAPDGTEVVVWRWYDAVVLGAEDNGSVHLWEPAHGEIVARPRASYQKQDPGPRAYASAGLPGAEWWVVGSTDVELDDVAALYTEHNLWPTAFGSHT
jgi:hypothetical protein